MTPRLALLLCLAAAGCTQLQPFAALPNPKPKGVTETGTRVAICYNPLWDSSAKLDKAAEGECGANAVPQKVDSDYELQHCPTLLPAHVTFLCKSK